MSARGTSRPQSNGVAHVLEHMAFKGTERRSALDIASEIEAVGGHVNAYTSREHTAYYAKVLKADVGLAVDILSDILQHAAFDAAELERERTVILQELGQAQDTPDDIIYDLFQRGPIPTSRWVSRFFGPRRYHQDAQPRRGRELHESELRRAGHVARRRRQPHA